ncbi:MAG: ATP-binding protein [Thermoproteota archaeon]
MKPWWQVVVPHKDIREGIIEESVFAANLGDVFRDKGPLDYRDPETFFRKTYFTPGLTNLIEVVLSELSGKSKGSSVVQIQTPFGGGKTHALLTLYHTFKYGDRVKDFDVIKKILKESKVHTIPNAKVVVFVGEYADPLKGRTLWGEIAYQLGSYEVMKDYDEKRVAPGKEIISKILSENKPVLILMDELVQYIVRAMGVSVKEGTLKGQVLAFLKSLTEAVAIADRCVLVATLPSSVREGLEEEEKAGKVLSELQKIFGRIEKIYTPVEGEEIYEIIRKRLFDDLGDVAEHKAVADEYFSLYQKLGEDVPPECKELSYKQKIVKAYPFHPETIDVLFERWATIPGFQRTRGVLRLLAEVVADLYKREHPAPLIQPADINLANSAIKREFIKHIGNEFESVIASDITGPNAKASKIDKEMGTEYSKYKVATGLATSIFFYSFSGSERKGVTAQRLRLAFLREGIPAAIVGDALRRLEDELWFLHFEKNFYYFSNIVGLNRVIIDKEETIKDDEIVEEIRKRIERIAGKDFDVFVWPKSSNDVPDNKKLKLIVLFPTYSVDNPLTKEFITNIISQYSTSFRVYKNALMFLISDSSEYENLKNTIRRFLALNAIKMDKILIKRFTEDDKERVEQKFDEVDSSIPFKILSMYRYMAKASKDGVKVFDLGIPTAGEKLSLTSRVKHYLKNQEMLLDKISPSVLFEKTFSKEDESKTFVELWETFLKFPDLPLLENEHVLKNAIVEGVQNGTFGLSIEDEIRYAEMISSMEVTEESLVVRKEIARKKKEETGEIQTSAEVTPSTATAEFTEQRPTLEASIRKITIRALVPYDKLSYLLQGVLSPLNREGAEISLEVKIEAQSENGIKRNTLNIVRETLSQINAKVLEEKQE